MIELYFNDANLLPENREEEQYAEAALNNILAGKTADTEMCILPCFYDAPLHKGLLYHLNDGTTLRIGPVLNETGEPELLIRCVTERASRQSTRGLRITTKASAEPTMNLFSKINFNEKELLLWLKIT